MSTPKAVDLDREIRNALSSAIRRSGKSREEIAEELSQACGLNVSAYTLNNWTCDSKRERRMPAEAIPALCAVLGDETLQLLLLGDEQLERLEFGRFFSKWLDRKLGASKGQEEARRLLGKTEQRAVPKSQTER